MNADKIKSKILQTVDSDDPAVYYGFKKLEEDLEKNPAMFALPFDDMQRIFQQYRRDYYLKICRWR